MIRLEWNGLRPGHRVLVHDEDAAGMPLVDGVVTLVQTAPASNEVGVRISPAGGATRVVRPRRVAVHLDPLDAAEPCWRCTRAGSGDRAAIR